MTKKFSRSILSYIKIDAGWSSLEARRAHNPKAAGSNPAPAIDERRNLEGFLFLLLFSQRPFQLFF